MDRQKAIDYIEGKVGIFNAVWNEWPTDAIRGLYIYVCLAEHGTITLEDSVRVGVTL